MGGPRQRGLGNPALVRIRRTVWRLRSVPPLPQQLGEVSAICAGVMRAGQIHHCRSQVIGDGVWGTATPVTAGQCGDGGLAISPQDALGMALGHSQHFGCLVNR